MIPESDASNKTANDFNEESVNKRSMPYQLDYPGFRQNLVAGSTHPTLGDNAYNSAYDSDLDNVESRLWVCHMCEESTRSYEPMFVSNPSCYVCYHETCSSCRIQEVWF